MAVSRKFVLQLSLVLAGVGIGVLVGWSLSRNAQFQAGQGQLQGFTERRLHNAESVATEVQDTIDLVLASHRSICSDQDLSWLRVIVFSSTNIKDIGRLRDDQLICTTGMGRLPTPLPANIPDLAGDGISYFANAPLLIAPEARGFIIQSHGVSVVLNPQAYGFLDSAPIFLGVLFYAQPTAANATPHTVLAFGHPIPLSDADVLAGKLILRNGTYYQPRCSVALPVCIVASESRIDLLNRNRMHRFSYFFIGGLVGGLVLLSIVLFYNHQLTLPRRLRRAIRRNKLSVVYQPVVCLRTNQIIGAEALIRWRTGPRHVITPEHFISIAEQQGFVTEITRFVISTAVDELSSLLREKGFSVTINITAQDLAADSFFTHLENTVSRAGISPSAIGVELTERCTADRSLSITAIARLRAAGHGVYIDDFGTGYSSLAYLHDLNASAIKIDRAFTRTVGTGAVTASVVPQILDIASQLNLMVVVEGIETEQQAIYFRNFGKSHATTSSEYRLPQNFVAPSFLPQGIFGQGWFFGRPMPAPELKTLLRYQAVAHAAADTPTTPESKGPTPSPTHPPIPA